MASLALEAKESSLYIQSLSHLVYIYIDIYKKYILYAYIIYRVDFLVSSNILEIYNNIFFTLL